MELVEKYYLCLPESRAKAMEFNKPGKIETNKSILGEVIVIAETSKNKGYFYGAFVVETAEPSEKKYIMRYNELIKLVDLQVQDVKRGVHKMIIPEEYLIQLPKKPVLHSDIFKRKNVKRRILKELSLWAIGFALVFLIIVILMYMLR